MEIPWCYYALAILFSIALWMIWKRPVFALLVGYSVLLLVETVLIRQPFVGQHFQPELFWSWKAWKIQKNQIISNVIMFIPIGILTGWLWKGHGLWVAAGLSLAIEVLQLLTQRGLMEFDDVIHNCLGAAIGIAIVMTGRKMMNAGRR